MNQRRLATVLRIRALQERTARGSLAVANATRRAAVAAEQRTWTQLDAQGQVHATVEARELVAARAAVEAGLRSAETRHAETRRATEVATATRAEWQTAARRVEGLERLAERLAEEAALEAERSASNELDDLVLARRGRGTNDRVTTARGAA